MPVGGGVRQCARRRLPAAWLSAGLTGWRWSSALARVRAQHPIRAAPIARRMHAHAGRRWGSLPAASLTAEWADTVTVSELPGAWVAKEHSEGSMPDALPLLQGSPL